MFDKLLNVVKAYVYDVVEKGEEKFGMDPNDTDEEWEAFKREQARKYGGKSSYSGSKGSSTIKSLNKEIESFKMLEIPKTSEFSIIKKQYRKLMKANHPDRFQNDEKRRKEAEIYTAKLNVAFDYLEKRYGKK